MNHAKILELYKYATLYLRTALVFLLAAGISSFWKNWKLTGILLGGFAVFYLIGYLYAVKARRLEKR